MSLLFSHELFKHLLCDARPQILGIDISSAAVALARRNLRRLRCQGLIGRERIEFARGDVLDPWRMKRSPRDAVGVLRLLETLERKRYDVVLANPPYISPKQYWSGETARSVRCFEPKLALVPSEDKVEGARGGVSSSDGEPAGDVFYPVIMAIARIVEAKIVMMEVGGVDQAQRVSKMAVKDGWEGIEIWRDQPYADEPREWMLEHGSKDMENIAIRGQGEARNVVCLLGEGKEWISA